MKENFLASALKKLLTLQDKLSNTENQRSSYSLELLAYYCIDYSLAIRLLITHPIIGI